MIEITLIIGLAAFFRPELSDWFYKLKPKNIKDLEEKVKEHSKILRNSKP